MKKDRPANRLKSAKKGDKQKFKYWKRCKLPSCGEEFGTNRAWQEFCPGKRHQQEYQKLLRRKHEDVVVEIEVLKERLKKMEAALEQALEQFGKYKNWLHGQFQVHGTPKELRDMIRAVEQDVGTLRRKHHTP